MADYISEIKPDAVQMLESDGVTFRLMLYNPKVTPPQVKRETVANAGCPICHGRGTDGFGKPCRRCERG